MFLTCIFLSLFSPIASSTQNNALSLALNINGGAYLQLSNGKFYAIDPVHRIYSSAWITPFNISLSTSADPKYPIKITNLRTGTSVNARLLTEEERKELQSISPEMTPSPIEPQPPNLPSPSPPAPPPASPSTPPAKSLQPVPMKPPPPPPIGPPPNLQPGASK